jgi:hypothetical protein
VSSELLLHAQTRLTKATATPVRTFTLGLPLVEQAHGWALAR